MPLSFLSAQIRLIRVNPRPILFIPLGSKTAAESNADLHTSRRFAQIAIPSAKIGLIRGHLRPILRTYTYLLVGQESTLC